MHPRALQAVVESVRRRMAQGDCPTEAPFTVEQLENAVDSLAPRKLALLVTDEWLRRRIAEDPDVDTEAGMPLPLKSEGKPDASGTAKCEHLRTERGVDIPLPLGGSYRSEVCLDCGATRTRGHSPDVAIGDWSTGARPSPETVYLYCNFCSRIEGLPFAVGDGCPAHCGGTLVDADAPKPAPTLSKSETVEAGASGTAEDGARRAYEHTSAIVLDPDLPPPRWNQMGSWREFLVEFYRFVRAESEQRVREIQALIDRDRTGLAAALSAVLDACKGSWWITEGRGSYEWDDDKYREETKWFIERVMGIAGPALQRSGALAQTAFHPSTKPVATYDELEKLLASRLERLSAAEQQLATLKAEKEDTLRLAKSTQRELNEALGRVMAEKEAAESLVAEYRAGYEQRGETIAAIIKAMLGGKTDGVLECDPVYYAEYLLEKKEAAEARVEELESAAVDWATCDKNYDEPPDSFLFDKLMALGLIDQNGGRVPKEKER